MSNDKLLAVFDREMRVGVQIHEPGFRIDREPGYVRIVGPSPDGHENFIIYSNIIDAQADAAIAEQIAYFDQLGHGFEWKLFDHDRPGDLAERLIAHGFEPDTPETVLVADLTEPRKKTFVGAGIGIRRVDHPGMLPHVIRVQDEVWGENHNWIVDMLSREMRAAAHNVQILLAEHDGKPIACSWMRIHPGTQFASLWGAATLPEFRGRRIYTSLVDCHCEEARQMGARYIYADANSNSRPVLEKLGFRPLVGVRGYVWRGPDAREPFIAKS